MKGQNPKVISEDYTQISFSARVPGASKNLHQRRTMYNRCLTKQIYGLALFLGASTRQPFSSRLLGKGARQLLICDFNLGMLGCALLHRWHRNSIDNKLSSSFNVALPWLMISSSTSTELQKNAVLKEFQCFLFLRCLELKSWLITCRCSWRIDGACKKRVPNDLRKPTFFKFHQICL